MPKISIVIPAYNVEPYIGECLDSVTAQTFDDFEAIVINDCSTDKTAEIAKRYARQNSHITVIDHSKNQGTHLTRRTGVMQAKGDYTFFLDGDDALAPTMLAELATQIDHEPADILHYGLTVVAANDLQDNERHAFDAFNNASTEPARGLDILRNIFDEVRGQKVDWRFTQRLYRTSLLQQAFTEMTDSRLGRSQDGYECFVVSALAQSYRPIKQCKGYIYYYGRGISGTDNITVEKYDKYCHDFKADFDATYDFAKSTDSDIIQTCAVGFERHATELLANDWLVRIDEAGKADAATAMTEVFGSVVTAREIYRFVRDRSYEFIEHHAIPAGDDPLYEWLRIAQSLPQDTNADTSQVARCSAMQQTALDHVHQLNNTRQIKQYKEQRIRIFVTTHKTVNVPQGDIFQPVQVGSGLKSERFGWSFHDDEGENISEKNPMYCELTTQYWAWKNMDADYYGFCHYRRYFDFSPTPHRENEYGEIMDDYIDDTAIAKYHLDDQSVRNTVEGYDVVTTGIQDLRKIIGKHNTPFELYRVAPYLHIKDLKTVCKIVLDQHPDYQQDVEQFLNGHASCFCNMYIMRKQTFFDYCEWVFPILEAFEQKTDMSIYSTEALRTPGHLSERLFNIWLIHQKRTNPVLKTKELQCVHFTNPEPEIQQHQLVQRNDDIVPVVFAADDGYVPMLTTAMYSMMNNASQNRFYDVSVLHRDISARNQQIMRTWFSQFTNMNLRFIDVGREIANYTLTTSNAHISVETYYRFLVQKILPFYSKVLYLDSDIIVQGDVAELYDTDVNNYLIAAVRDIDYLGNLNHNDGKRMAYSTNVLKMRNPYDYFQAGVLILNTAAMRRKYSVKQWLTFASNPDFIYNDQDVLNTHCQGMVRYLDWDWNVMHDCDGRVAKVFTFAPANIYDAYMESRRAPKIIHYAGFIKPWKNASCDFADVYWHYARQTPFYEQLVSLLSAGNTKRIPTAPVHERAVSSSSRIRKFIDPLAPIGSKRREALKSVARTIQRRR